MRPSQIRGFESAAQPRLVLTHSQHLELRVGLAPAGAFETDSAQDGNDKARATDVSETLADLKPVPRLPSFAFRDYSDEAWIWASRLPAEKWPVLKKASCQLLVARDAPASRYGCHGYRRIASLLKEAVWTAEVKRVEWIWRSEGLTVTPAPTRCESHLPIKQENAVTSWI
ncbi:hypothetical protein SAMN04488094_1047 [Tropicimonas isoalkanivorans]|uniref:Uncharacterized protein n=1 Tax=Tropicimonas isoalkanivorans TaxID=441112 RepID=A0A1I1ICA1_9RHOB|nr:hypothetical protein SAMN04488094_1047 [Tropicimonas isoalkanivorans]